MLAPARGRRRLLKSSPWRCFVPGSCVQAFPEYGPERRGAPLRAYTRSSDLPIRRHDAVEHPNVVVVLEPSLVGEAGVTEGLTDDGVVFVNAERNPPRSWANTWSCVPASQLASERGSGFVNVTMLGAVGAALGEPSLEAIQDAAVEVLGGKVDEGAVRDAVEEGYRCLR